MLKFSYLKSFKLFRNICRESTRILGRVYKGDVGAGKGDSWRNKQLLLLNREGILNILTESQRFVLKNVLPCTMLLKYFSRKEGQVEGELFPQFIFFLFPDIFAPIFSMISRLLFQDETIMFMHFVYKKTRHFFLILASCSGHLLLGLQEPKYLKQGNYIQIQLATIITLHPPCN